MHFKKKKKLALGSPCVFDIYRRYMHPNTHTQTDKQIYLNQAALLSLFLFSLSQHSLFIIQWTWYPRFPCVHIEAAAAADAAADDNDDCDVNRERTETIFFILF